MIIESVLVLDKEIIILTNLNMVKVFMDESTKKTACEVIRRYDN